MARQNAGNGHPTDRLMAVAGQLTKTGLRSSEMGVAAAQTIGYRTAMMTAALSNPIDFANPEFIRMGAEKVEAAVEAFHAVATGIGEFGQAWITMITKQTQAAATTIGGLASCKNPAEIIDVQQRLLADVVDAGIHANLRLIEATAAIAAAGMNPAYRKVRANARRLAREQA
ncbi:hypothetical protein TSH100_15040 [Azospirillum sp. TSH100]|uniref:phasin family protein n=1 Tax=Azospirillum sp. TSH100 TaxID=652764 RepID=UPI000D610054|nr:phasin family protein [Azospirillum sp. TSH100]PWC85879.1 hypothetical protein TSH100_15040 [Azospirillum sp. TSH100]QCG87933.1 phasin family protein [Azospirillum sp. TSH100]